MHGLRGCTHLSESSMLINIGSTQCLYGPIWDAATCNCNSKKAGDNFRYIEAGLNDPRNSRMWHPNAMCWAEQTPAGPDSMTWSPVPAFPPCMPSRSGNRLTYMPPTLTPFTERSTMHYAPSLKEALPVSLLNMHIAHCLQAAASSHAACTNDHL